MSTVPLLDQHHDQPATPHPRAFGRAAVQVLGLWQGLHPEDPDDQAQLHRAHARHRCACIGGVADGARAFVTSAAGKLALQLFQMRRSVPRRSASLTAHDARAHGAMSNVQLSMKVVCQARFLIISTERHQYGTKNDDNENAH